MTGPREIKITLDPLDPSDLEMLSYEQQMLLRLTADEVTNGRIDQPMRELLDDWILADRR